MELTSSNKQVNMIYFSFLAIAVGVVTGFGALAFHFLISIIHNISFSGDWSFHHDANQLSAISPLGPLVILIPVIGGLGVVYLVKKFAPEASGHGVPEVMYAVYYKEGKMRPIVALIKSLASALSIGTGASVGQEGPIIQTGASLGSSIAQLFRLVPWQRTTLLAAGAGSGIAATFNTPLGGVLFAIEIMMLEVSSRTFLPIVLATGTATYIGRLFFGLQPAFMVPIASMPSLEPVAIPQLFGFMVLGCVCGLVSWLFIDILTFMEKSFKKIKVNDYVRNVIGMSMVGTIMYILSLNYGYYFVDGTGHGTIQGILHGNIEAVGLLVLLSVLKLLATSISLGSGASGGIFSPSMFIGACVGGAFGGGLSLILPGYEFSIIEFAMVGMAAVIGGTTGAAVTAIIMIFEMTRDYNIIVPLIMAVAISIGIRRVLTKENIYTVTLLWRGLRIPEKRHINMFLVRHAKDVMESSICSMSGDTTLDTMIHNLRNMENKTHVIVTDDGKVVGTIPVTHIMRAAEGITNSIKLHEVMIDNFIMVSGDDIFHDIMKRLRHKGSNIAIVMKDRHHHLTEDNVVGIISKDRIIDSILDYFK